MHVYEPALPFCVDSSPETVWSIKCHTFTSCMMLGPLWDCDLPSITRTFTERQGSKLCLISEHLVDFIGNLNWKFQTKSGTGTCERIRHSQWLWTHSGDRSPGLTKAGSAPIRYDLSGLILGLRPANEIRRYFVTTSLIGWAQVLSRLNLGLRPANEIRFYFVTICLSLAGRKPKISSVCVVHQESLLRTQMKWD